MALNLHLVRLFAAVVDQGSFHGAAEALYVSQPAISKGVRELERQVGLTLLDRSRQPVSPTPAGAVLYRSAQRMFRAEQAAELELRQLRDVDSGRLAIGASTTPGIYILPQLLGAFHERHPSVQLLLDIDTTPEILHRLQAGRLDVAFVEGLVGETEMVVVQWLQEDLIVIASPMHPLALMAHPTVAQILAEPFIIREPGSNTREIIDQALAARGWSLRGAMEIGNTEAMKRMVTAGLGLAIVPAITVADECRVGSLAILDIPELRISRTYARVQLHPHPINPALQAFLDEIDHR